MGVSGLCWQSTGSLPGQSHQHQGLPETEPFLPATVCLPQAGPTTGHQGPRSIWWDAWAKRLPIFPCLSCWYPGFLCHIGCQPDPQIQSPELQHLTFSCLSPQSLATHLEAPVLRSCSLHLHPWLSTVAMLPSLNLRYFFLCKPATCNWLYYGQIGVGWGERETGTGSGEEQSLMGPSDTGRWAGASREAAPRIKYLGEAQWPPPLTARGELGLARTAQKGTEN